MKEYSKFRVSKSTKSRSMDFPSDVHLSSSPPPQESPKPISSPNPTLLSDNPTLVSNNPTPTSNTPNSTSHSNNNNNNNNNNNKSNTASAHDVSTPNNEQENGVIDGERFGVILSRNCSVSSTPSSQKIRAENQKQNKALQAAVVRAFSMRRSASVSEGYSRIHDQSDPFSALTEDDQIIQTKSKKKKKGSKILKACRSFFGY